MSMPRGGHSSEVEVDTKAGGRTKDEVVADLRERAVLVSATAFAHGPDKGVNGGLQVDAGDYHVEMIAKGTQLAVFLSDDNDKPVDAAGFKATGIFVVAGQPQRIELKPESANKLVGTSSIALPQALKGAVQITLPHGQNRAGQV